MNDDLICRQAAIDAFEEVDWYHQNKNKDMVSGANSSEHQAWYKADDIYKTLEALPSAQQWIPVSERLPNQNERFLVQYEDGGMDVARCSDVNPFWTNLKTDWHWVDTVQFAEVVAWMPLPKPLKGEEDA